MNHVTLLGRLTKDIELKTGGANNMSYARFTIAVGRKFKNNDGKYDADFITCLSFGKTAEFIDKYFHKGSQIAVGGRIQTGNYKDKDGKTVYTTDVVVDEADFVDPKSKDSGSFSGSSTKVDTSTAKDDDFMTLPSGLDEELPFA